MQAKVVRSIMEHCGDIIRALVSGAAAEPDLALVLAEGHRRHVEGARRIVGLLQELGALDASVTAEAAVDTLSATTDASFALLLADAYGWSLDAIETWITDHHPHTAPRPPLTDRVSPGQRTAPDAELASSGAGRSGGQAGSTVDSSTQPTSMNLSAIFQHAVDLADGVVVPGDDLAARVRCRRCRLVRRVVRQRLRLRLADEVDVVHVQHVVLPRGVGRHPVDPRQQLVAAVHDDIAVAGVDVVAEQRPQAV